MLLRLTSPYYSDPCWTLRGFVAITIFPETRQCCGARSSLGQHSLQMAAHGVSFAACPVAPHLVSARHKELGPTELCTQCGFLNVLVI